MAPENFVINIMEEISTNSDEYVVKNANKILRNIMGFTEEREPMETPEKIENNPSPDSEEPTLGDVENLDNEVATTIVERFPEASQDMDGNIMDSSTGEKTTANSPDTTEELPTALNNKESLDNDEVTSRATSLVRLLMALSETLWS